MLYQKELDMMVRLGNALLYIQEQLEANPVQTPCAMLAYTTVLYGVVPTIKAPCAHDDECEVTASVPCGGLVDALGTIREAIDILQLEVRAGEITELQALQDTEDDDGTLHGSSPES